MATYADLKARVLRRLIDTPTAVQAEVPTLVNEAMRALQDHHNFQVMGGATATLMTVIGERTLVGVPSDWKSQKARGWSAADDGHVMELITPEGLGATQRYYETDDEGAPRVIFPGDWDEDGVRSMQVWPLPDGNSDYDDGEYRITIPYWRYLPALSADLDTNWFTQLGPAALFIIFKATAEGFAVDWDEERAAFWEQKASNELGLAVRSDKRAVVEGLDTLVPYRGAHDPQLRG